MERREFLKIAVGVAAGITTLAATAYAAPLVPQPIDGNAKLPESPVQPAVTSREESERLQPEEVRWGRGRHRGWDRRHWGWRRRRWWGFHRRRWRRRHWRRRYAW